MDYLKQQLHNHCLTYIKDRIDSINHTIASAQQAANDDTKSSAGDKYETTREMMQQETDRNTGLLNEANKLMALLIRIPLNGTSVAAGLGSVAITNNGNFYIAVSAGSATVDGQNYFAISQASPIGLKLVGCKAGDTFVLNGKQYQIKQVL